MSFAHLAFSSNGVRPLASLALGARGTIVDLSRHNPDRADRLAALGVTPGARVTVLQTFPGIVFLCDQTELAIERDVAEAILVRPLEGSA
jgi:DtxR family transcriptional regulator, Mn-dependent transcriptional regulator